jgi:hypothetical protein
VVWPNSGVCKNDLSAGLNVQLVLRSGNKGYCRATIVRSGPSIGNLRRLANSDGFELFRL